LSELEAGRYTNMATPRALRSAVKRGDAKKVADLLAAGADVHDVDPAGRSALTWAATQGKQAVIAVLVNGGADVDHQDDEGWTALMYSAYRGHADTTRQLLEAHADSTRCACCGDWEAKTALEIAEGREHANCVALLRSGRGSELVSEPEPEPEPEPELTEAEAEAEADGLRARAILEEQRREWAEWEDWEDASDERWSPDVPGSVSWHSIRQLQMPAAESALGPGGAGAGTVGLSRECVSDGIVSNCTICLEPVQDGVEIVTMPCAHRHHAECIMSWLRRKNECPDCRGRVLEQHAWNQWQAAAVATAATTGD
jgi:hypothetical protein